MFNGGWGGKVLGVIDLWHSFYGVYFAVTNHKATSIKRNYYILSQLKLASLRDFITHCTKCLYAWRVI